MLGDLLVALVVVLPPHIVKEATLDVGQARVQPLAVLVLRAVERVVAELRAILELASFQHQRQRARLLLPHRLRKIERR
eukprot:5932585-Prymnesium_polylepis.1